MKEHALAITRSSAGYTLLELLVVVTIMALAASVAFPFVAGQTSNSVRLAAATRVFAGALRSTRANAILRDTQAILVIDVRQHTLSSPALPVRPFDSDIAVRLKVAEPERLSLSRAGIRFYPDGTSTGGDLYLSLHGQESHICVNWLTGAPHLGSEC